MIRRRSAKVLLVDPAGRTLLFQVRQPSGPDAIGYWFPPGGGVEEGEDLAVAARREVREEVGVELLSVGEVVDRREAIFTFEGNTYQQDEHYFVVRVPTLTVDDAGWTDVERRAIAASRWWSRHELRSTAETVFPERLAELLDRCAPIAPTGTEPAPQALPSSSTVRFDIPDRQDLESLRATGLGMPRQPDLTDAARWLDSASEHYSRLGFGYWALRSRDGGPCLGFAGVEDRGEAGIWLGCAIHPDFRRRGLATEAAMAVVLWCRGWLLRPLWASVRPPNPASEVVLQRSGLTQHLRMTDAQGLRLVYLDT